MKILNAANFEAEALSKGKPKVVDFWAPWCGPCRQLLPFLEALAAELESADVCKLDVQENPEVAKKYKITQIPCLIVFKDGKETARAVGISPSQEALRAFIENHV